MLYCEASAWWTLIHHGDSEIRWLTATIMYVILTESGGTSCSAAKRKWWWEDDEQPMFHKAEHLGLPAGSVIFGEPTPTSAVTHAPRLELQYLE